MAKINKDVAAAVMDGAALNTQSKAAGTDEEVQRQVMVYDVPKAWINAVKNGAHATMSGYMKAALYEKLQRDGHL